MVNSIIIGYGSVGKRHHRILAEKGECFLIEPKKLQGISPTSLLFTSSEEFLAAAEFRAISNLNEYLVVLSNWGPDHVSEMRKFLECGFTNFIIEKPIASSMRELSFIETVLLDSRIIIWSNFHLRFDSGIHKLRKFIAQNNLGQIQLFSVSGGARCLSTNGIHWLDLFFFLQDVKLETFSAEFLDDALNPRNPSLAFLSGYLYCRNEDSSRFLMIFTNKSRSNEIIEIFWERYRAEIIGDKIQVFVSRNSKSDVITKTEDFSDLVFETQILGDGMNLLYQEFFKTKESMANLVKANKILLAAMNSNFVRRYSEDLRESTEVEKDWRIS